MEETPEPAKQPPKKKPLSRDKQRAVDRSKRESADKQLRGILSKCPKGVYSELSGRQHKVLDEQAGRYGLPLLGKEIDLGAVLRRFHDLLRDHGDQIAGERPDGQPVTEWDEDVKKQRALLLRLDVAERCGELLRKHLVDQILQQVAGLLRSAGERMQHEGHEEAYKILDETLIDAQSSVDELLGSQPPLQDEIADQE